MTPQDTLPLVLEDQWARIVIDHDGREVSASGAMPAALIPERLKALRKAMPTTPLRAKSVKKPSNTVPARRRA